MVASMSVDLDKPALNDEATLAVPDRTVGQQMNQMFLDDLRHAQEITAAEFRQRP
jgi:phosphatidylserine/phosphatidylglycerophosphate/cardiolipin synthase-like enzyme